MNCTIVAQPRPDAALVAFPVYVCDGGEIPLTRALLAMGVGPGPAFCFMLASVGTCLQTIAMATRIIGWTVTVIYVAAWLVLAVGGGLLMGLLLLSGTSAGFIKRLRCACDGSEGEPLCLGKMTLFRNE